jgi:hypothetical protein
MKAQMVIQAKESQEREIALKNLYLEVSRLKADKAATVAAAESERAKIAERRAEVAAAAAVAAVKAAELAAAARVIAAAAAEEQRIKDIEIALKKKEDDAKKEEELMIKQIEENMKREEEVYARMKEEKKRDAEAKDKKARILEAKRIKLLKINKNENVTPIRNKERENGMTPDSSGVKSQVLINGEIIGDENERYERRNGDSAGVGVGVGVSGSMSGERGGEEKSIENTTYQTNSNSNSISKSYSSTPQGMQEEDGRSLSSFRSPYSSYGMGYKDQETTPRANTSTNTDGEAFSERYVRTSAS